MRIILEPSLEAALHGRETFSICPSSRPSFRPSVRPSTNLKVRARASFQGDLVRPSFRPSVLPSVRPSFRPSIRSSFRQSVRPHALLPCRHHFSVDEASIRYHHPPKHPSPHLTPAEAFTGSPKQIFFDARGFFNLKMRRSRKPEGRTARREGGFRVAQLESRGTS